MKEDMNKLETLQSFFKNKLNSNNLFDLFVSYVECAQYHNIYMGWDIDHHIKKTELKYLIQFGFTWGLTPQKYDYWYAVNIEWLKYLETLKENHGIE